MNLTSKSRFFVTGFALAAFCLVVSAHTPPTAGTEDTKLVSDLQARVKAYLDLRQKAAGNPPSSDSTPDHIVSKQRDLAAKVRVVRAGAKQGEIFTPDIARYLRRQIAATLAGSHGNEIRASLRHAEPVKMELQINQSYPEHVPLQSTPPTLLLNLPQLPDGLEYRILDRELVLRDSEANIVVDYVPNALPDVGR
jgi:hypothetical protein